MRCPVFNVCLTLVFSALMLAACGGSETNWSAIAAGHDHTVALKSDGTLWTWGWNNRGQLGYPATATIAKIITPTQIGAATWSAIDAGTFHTVALK